MATTIVNDYYFKPGGDIEEGKAAAAELIKYFKEEVPEVQLSLWLESKKNPGHHFHITVFENEEVIDGVRKSEAIKRFVERLYPHIDRETHLAPVCNVWLSDGSGVKPVAYQA